MFSVLIAIILGNQLVPTDLDRMVSGYHFIWAWTHLFLWGLANWHFKPKMSLYSDFMSSAFGTSMGYDHKTSSRCHGPTIYSFLFSMMNLFAFSTSLVIQWSGPKAGVTLFMIAIISLAQNGMKFYGKHGFNHGCIPY